MTFIKYLQRKTYDALSDRPLLLSVILLLLVFFLLCQLYEIYIISSRNILKAVCDRKCCDNIDSVCAPCEPIDAVYTWVNGSDPVWLNEIKKYTGSRVYSSDDFDPSRYDDKQELKYSLRSLELYAPWIRKVYIVTAGQIPWWLNVWNSKVQIITHEEIIPKEYLPTFSSPAIECFLHNIPDLSEKFLYINDDIFLGGPLHLSDLYIESEGYQVYTAWNVPDCAQGCPWSFIGDKSCDDPCNNKECDFDGGDCTEDPKYKHYGAGNSLDYLDDYADNPFFDEDQYPDNGDKYPGLDDPAMNPQVIQARQHEDQNILDNLRAGRKYGESVKVVRSDIEDDFWGVKKDDTGADERKSMRGLKQIQSAPEREEKLKKNKVLSNKLVASQNKVQNITIGRNNSQGKDKNVENKPKVNLISLLVGSSKKNVNISGLVDKYNRNYLKTDKKLRKRKLPSVDKNTDDRKLAMYAKSLIYTNKIFNKAYGFQNRKVPAHIPFLMEKSTIKRLQERFKEHVEMTANNKFRRGDDLQFSFSYYYYLLNEKKMWTIEEIFDKYDTDKSGTWSDREVRTVLAKVRGLPLTIEVVRALEAAARQCDKEEYRMHPTPPYERYLDSEMTTLTKALVVSCKSIRTPLLKYTWETTKPRAVAKPGTLYSTFAMLESNITKAVHSLDEIRGETKKFVCINDNLDPKQEQESAVVRMMLQELYEALLPLPSQFELPEGVGNRFLRLSELKEWRDGRKRALIGLSLCAVLLVFISFYHVKKIVRHTVTKIYHLL